ncbi:MAG: hypothetical protein Q4P71_08595 [Actinomycetaceae bacterium]|nr:hypothetical protein [Actinomycetaceae bacterium]
MVDSRKRRKPTQNQRRRASSGQRGTPGGRRQGSSGQSRAIKSGSRKARPQPRKNPSGGRPLTPAQERRRQARRSILIRRTLSIVVLIAALVGLFFLGKFVWESVQVSLAQHKDANEKVDDVPDPILACTPKDLTAAMSDMASTATVGSGWSATVTLTNTSDKECTTDGTAKSVGLSITSGDYHVVDTTKCADQSAEKLLLLGPGRSWTTKVYWDGNTYSNCEVQSVAAAGTYVMKMIVPSASGNDEGVVVLEDPPPPPPSESSDESSDAEGGEESSSEEEPAQESE